MNVTIEDERNLRFMDARIVFRNFAGDKDKFRTDSRGFSIVIPDAETAEFLTENGWNVKIKQPREEGEDPFMTLPVKIGFKRGDPYVVLKTGNKEIELDRDSMGMIDDIDITSVDIIISPSDWDFNGRQGRTAYLEEILVHRRRRHFAHDDMDEELGD